MSKTTEKPELSDQDLLRYSRQIMLPQIDLAGQQKLLASHVVLFGVGGLGSAVAMYLVTSGIGKITLIDPDRVDLSNLQRQVIFRNDDIGCEKVSAAKEMLVAMNEQVTVCTVNSVLSHTQLKQVVAKADLAIDATDNFSARYAINCACVETHTPLIVGAAIRFEGQVTVFTMEADSACYKCLYPDQGNLEESCTQTGILGSVAGLIGCIQATEAIKLLLNAGEILLNKILLVDALNMEWHSVRINRDPKCAVCSSLKACA